MATLCRALTLGTPREIYFVDNKKLHTALIHGTANTLACNRWFPTTLTFVVVESRHRITS
jgi:hypothetical protein